jgi:hypothetical protein
MGGPLFFHGDKRLFGMSPRAHAHANNSPPLTHTSPPAGSRALMGSCAPSRSFAVSAASPSASSASDPEHKAWLEAVKKYPVAIPHFEWTLEWMLSTPFPLHQFTQSPLVIEVKDRNPNADDLVYSGPNVVGGFPHPDTGVKVTVEVRCHPPFFSSFYVALGEAGCPPPPPTLSTSVAFAHPHPPTYFGRDFEQQPFSPFAAIQGDQKGLE